MNGPLLDDEGVPPVPGVVRPMRVTVIREVNGWPVVVRYSPEGPLWALRCWGRFGGWR